MSTTRKVIKLRAGKLQQQTTRGGPSHYRGLPHGSVRRPHNPGGQTRDGWVQQDEQS
jgi:hypothetical protein